MIYGCTLWAVRAARGNALTVRFWNTEEGQLSWGPDRASRQRQCPTWGRTDETVTQGEGPGCCTSGMEQR